MIKEFQPGMVITVRHYQCNPYTVKFVDGLGNLHCRNCHNDYSEIPLRDFPDCTLLPESIYEGQEWVGNNSKQLAVVKCVSDGWVGYVKDGYNFCVTIVSFRECFTPKPAEPEKMVTIGGKEVSESTAAKALQEYMAKMEK